MGKTLLERIKTKSIRNKKSQLFTVLVILLISLMFVSFEVFSFIYERNTVKARVDTMDNFLFSVEKNLERQMYISGFRILFLAGEHITSTGSYIDVDDFFNEAFFNGTVGGNSSDIMNGATYDDLIDSINQKAKKINVNITLSNSSIAVAQEGPWAVNFSLISDFVMKDKEGLAKWEKKQVISAIIPISNFEDPLYTVNTYAKVSVKIAQTPYEGNYTNGSDVTNLFSHVDSNYYAANPSAPSFLKRLEGNLSADANGIESFVKIPDLSKQGLPTSTKSNIDYVYFSSNNPTFYSVSGMPSWFRIDGQDGHLEKYNVSSLIT